jgi:hypothetical protein
VAPSVHDALCAHATSGAVVKVMAANSSAKLRLMLKRIAVKAVVPAAMNIRG